MQVVLIETTARVACGHDLFRPDHQRFLRDSSSELLTYPKESHLATRKEAFRSSRRRALARSFSSKFAGLGDTCDSMALP